jgi:DNA-binding winged helix-turn-helix (wHTH) protein/Tol biopolymer transport system component
MEHRSCIFRFADVEVDESNFSVTKAGEVLPLEPKVFKVLQFLVHHPDRVVTKDELLDAVWNDCSVSESSLTRSVATLRRLLGDDIHEPRYIATVPTVGYRFLCDVQVSENGRVSGTASDPALGPLAEPPHAPPGQTPVEYPSENPPSEKKPGKRRLYWAVGGIAAAVAIAIFFLRSEPAVPIVEGVSQITDDDNPKSITGLVSDGSRVYFNEIRQGTQVLAQVATTGGESGVLAQNVPGSDLEDFASDPSRFIVNSSDLWLLPLPAGEPRRLPAHRTLGAGFFPDGRIVFSDGKEKSLKLIEKDGSNPRRLCDLPNLRNWPLNPVVSPDGKKIRFAVWYSRSKQEIWEVNADGSDAHPLLRDWQNRFDSCCGRWTADGKYFVFQSRREGRTDLWLLPERRRWFRGKPLPIRLTNGPLSYELPFPSANGKHIYVIGRKQRGELVRYDRNSQQFVPFLSGISATDATVSNDGRWVAYQSYPERSLWRSRIDGSERLQLTYPPTHVIYPRISPDGTKVAYGSEDENGIMNAYVVSMDGGVPTKIVDNAINAVNWSPDGNSVVANVTATPGVGTWNIQTTDLRTGKIARIPDSTGKGGVWWPSQNMLVAPDSTSQGEYPFVTFDFTTQKWSHLVYGPFDHWMSSPDGEYLYYTTGNVNPKIIRVRFSDHKVEEITGLKDFRRIEDEVTASWIGVTPDGDPLLTRDIGTDEIYDISLRWH